MVLVYLIEISVTLHRLKLIKPLVDAMAVITDKEKQNTYHKYMREQEFRAVADPMYFKVQRGEVTQSRV